MTTSRHKHAESVLIVGATSSLAQALIRNFAAKGYRLMLAARDEYEMEIIACDIAARYYIECRMLACDVLEPGFSASRFVDEAGDFDHAVIALGDMGGEDRDDPQNIAQTATINYTAPAQIAAAIASHMELQNKEGSIAIICSVAGDRGRQSNYPYGSAKGALATFASGLRNRYAKHGIHILTVKPGFIDTPMTWGMKSPLIASREYVAERIVRALEKRKNVIYVPWFWRFIMLIICSIPERIFKRLSL